MDRVRRIAVAATLLVSAAIAAPAAGLAAPTIGVEDDFFSPSRTTVTVGDSDIEWVWDLDSSSAGATENPHDVVSRDDLFDSGELTDSGSFERRASAGTFGYFCSIHAGMTGKLRVKPRVENLESGAGVEIRWAAPKSDTGDRFDTQTREPRSGWETVQRNGRKRSAFFLTEGGDAPRVFHFRVRSQRGRDSKRQSAWSPAVRVDPK